MCGGNPNTSNQQRVAGKMEGLAGGQALGQISQGQLTPYEQQMFDEQMNQVAMGEQGARQGIRENMAARGIFSSRGAVQAEAGVPMWMAQQRANIYGQRGAMSRQGIMGGTQLQGGLLGQAGNMYGNISQQQMQGQQGMFGSALGAGALLSAPFTGGASLAAYGAGQGAGLY